MLIPMTLALGPWRLAAQSPGLPEIPRLDIAVFPPETQKQVQQAYESALLHPGDAEASGKLGMVLDLYNRLDEGAACYQRAHSLDSRAFKWLYYLGMLLAKQKRSAEAAEAFREALRLEPAYAPARPKLAENLLAAGKLDESQQVYSAIVKEFPNSAEAHYGLGRIAVFRGELAEARASFRRACELFPPYGAAHYSLAQVERKLGEDADAAEQIKLYEANKNVVPPVEDPLRDALRALDMGAVSHLQRGVALEQVGRLDDATAETERAVQLDPSLVQGHANLIILYGRKGNVQKAEEHYGAVLALNPDQFPKAHYDYGVLLMRGGRYREAEEAFRRAIHANPSYAEAHNNLGALLQHQGRISEAAEEFRKTLESEPNYRQAHFNLGRILVNQGNYQAGIEEFEKILSPVDEKTPSYLYALGATYGRAGDRRNALRYLQQAREQALARGQTSLAASIDQDLDALKAHHEQ
jgi:tetratricopeptide (TPR) repeat protein